MKVSMGNRLVENIFSMVTLRAAEYILSFLLVPFLFRVLGPSSYGMIAFMQGIVGYFTLCVSYGFSLTAPRDLAQAEFLEIPRIFSMYFWSMVLLCVIVTVCFVPAYLALGTVFSGGADWALFLAVYTSVIGTVIFPVWYFQGVQQMRYITVLNLLGRILTMTGIFLFVRGPEDYVLATFLLSCTSMFAGAFSWKFIFKLHPGILRRPVWTDMKRAYREGRKTFLSSLAINLYTTSDIIILGVLTNPTVVGYYSGADKLVMCIKQTVFAVNSAVYPYVSRVMRDSPGKAFHFLRRQLYIYTVCGVIGGAALYILAPWGVPFLFGERYIRSIEPLQIMAFVPLAVAMSNVLGNETMLSLGMEKIYSRVLIAASILNLVIICPLISWNGAEGTAWSMLVTETFVTLAIAAILWKKRILLR